MNRLLFVAALLAGSSAGAQVAVPPFDLERLTLNPSGQGGLLVNGGQLLPAEHYRLGFTGHYEQEPLTLLDPDGNRLGAAVVSRTTAHLTAAYALNGWLEFGAELPIVVSQGSNRSFTSLGFNGVEPTALGTPWLQARAGILSEAEKNPIDLAVTLSAGLPVGSREALSRDENVSVALRVGAGHRFKDTVRLVADAGAVFRSTQALSPASAQLSDEVGPQLDLALAAHSLGPKLRWEANVRAGLPITRAPAAFEVLAGVRYPVQGVELYALGGPGFGQTPGTPLFRVLVGAAFSGPEVEQNAGGCATCSPCALAACADVDLDGDGLKNADDLCPTERGPASAKGCPDADGDGVLNAEDKCPAIPGPAELGGCPDTDADGLIDPADQCPREPGDPRDNGCPPRDTDGDGILDKDDACPGEKGVPERKGCPIRDSDGDGVLDDIDACPKEAGDPHYKGCPVPDTDKDGVTDLDDNCKNEPGPKENQGCPAKQKQLVVITREKLVIKERVFFDTGKATIQGRSFGLLDQVARVLVEHDEVERVIVEGHTDDRGKAEMNRKLSQARAESVKAYLVSKGVADKRLDAVGFGPDRPIATNKTGPGREQNRRVEFMIHAEKK